MNNITKNKNNFLSKNKTIYKYNNNKSNINNNFLPKKKYNESKLNFRSEKLNKKYKHKNSLKKKQYNKFKKFKKEFRVLPYRATRDAVEEDQKRIKKEGFFKFWYAAQAENKVFKKQVVNKEDLPTYLEWLVLKNNKMYKLMPRAYVPKKRKRRRFRFKVKIDPRMLKRYQHNKFRAKLNAEREKIKTRLNRHLISPTYLLSSMIVRKGKREKAARITHSMLIKLKHQRRGLRCYLWSRVLRKQLLKLKTYVGFKPLRLGSMRYKIPVPINHTKSISLAIRTLSQIARKKAVGIKMFDSVYNEVTSSFSRKSDTYKKTLEIHKLGVESRPYLRYARKKRK